MKIKDFKLERFFARYEFNTPYSLCSSDCETISVRELFGMEKDAGEKFMDLRLGYTESQGDPSLREGISSLYLNTRPDEFIVFSGAEEGIFIFMNSLLEKGDSIIVQSPCYQSLYEVAVSTGCSVVEWPLAPDNNWSPDLDRLKQSITKNTRAIVINFPHNPSGGFASKEQLAAIVQIAREHDLFLFSDEVYRGLEYDEANRLPAVCDIYEKGVSLGVMSKSFGLAGLRIGWVGTKDKALLNKIAAYKDYTTICNSAPSEFLATIALKHHDLLVKRNLEIIKKNLEHLDRFFQRFGHLVEWVKPKAGPVTFPLLKMDMDVESFCLDVIDKKGVLLLPGNLYNWTGNHFRMGFGRENMPEALELFSEYLQEYAG
ncbi:MAG: aminotransferase class I/II-fold pyridoxal phosphate-dependent enzyme [bacterium]|nr:aminotransferase class I/II-fold pyridoxal phosphate-dependent enzyme [bacterium]